MTAAPTTSSQTAFTAWKNWLKTTPWQLLVVGLSYVIVLLMVSLLCIDRSFMPGVFMGFGLFMFLAASALGAIWWAWSRGSLITRSVVSLSYFTALHAVYWLGIHMCYYCTTQFPELQREMHQFDTIRLYVITFFAACIFFPLLCARMLRGWLLEKRSVIGTFSHAPRTTISEIMCLTLLIGMTLAILRHPWQVYPAEHTVIAFTIMPITTLVFIPATRYLLHKIHPERALETGCMTIFVTTFFAMILIILSHFPIALAIQAPLFYIVMEMAVFTCVMIGPTLALLLIPLAYCRLIGFELRTWRDEITGKQPFFIEDTIARLRQPTPEGIEFLQQLQLPETTGEQVPPEREQP